MELAHSLLLNESALERISDNKKPVFIFEWLRFLDKVLIAAHKSDIKEKQERLVQQLVGQLYKAPGPPTRKLLARNIATLYSVGDTLTLFATIDTCNGIIRSKDDSPSYLATRLAAMACLGAMYGRLGRMVGRSYEDTVQLLGKWVKQAESQGRCEMMRCLESIVEGLGSAASPSHKEIFKATKSCMTDRAMSVRSAAAKCMFALVSQCPIGQPADLETIFSICLRALEGSNYDVRCDVAKVMGFLLAKALTPTGPPPPANQPSKQKRYSVEEALNFLSAGFLKGGGGFLKGASASEMIKGNGSSNREIRVGVTHAYVELAKCMGGKWAERNLPVFLRHVLSLVGGNSRATATHVDAVYSRKCVQFVLRSVFRWVLSEKAATGAAREMCVVIGSCVEGVVGAGAGTGGEEGAWDQFQILVCALHELGHLLHQLDTAAAPLLDPPTSVVDTIMAVLLHPASAARLAAAYALRSLAVALPNQLTPLLDQCMQKVQALKTSPEAVSGYSYALAALLAGVREGELGIPQAKGKQVFTLAEELLRSANQNSRLTLPRTQAGWFLLGACMTLGGPAVKPHLPRMLLLWRNAFPRSSKELEAERSRGDVFTWQVTLEARAGALCAMQSFLEHCEDLVTEETIRRLLAPIECALSMLAQMTGIVRSHGGQLKPAAAMVRLRVYHVLLLLPTNAYTGAYHSLLRELVAEFTLTENPANTTTSLLRQLCHVDDSVILGSWLQETDHKAIEDQMEPNRRLDNDHLQPNSASGSGALEHDASSLFLKQTHNTTEEGGYPGPLPLGVAVIDASVQLFGAIFPRVQHRHRLQMLEHFAECIKQAKSARQQAVQINIFTAYLCAMKRLSDTKTPFGAEHDLRKAAVALIFDALGSSNPILRCAAGECLGRMAQVIKEARFIAEMAQSSFDRLRQVRDVVLRTGHSLALGCLHRYVGGLSSGQHLTTSVGVLLALAQDINSPVVQVWALHALALIADSGGPMFRDFVEPSLSLILQLLLQVPPSLIDVHQCLGKVLGALITTLGPELQGNSGSIATARLSCLVCCAVMQDHPDSLVQAEAISCLQQLHMFAPRHVNLSTLVPHLCACLSSRHLLLRRAAVACLRQLAQKEAGEVCELAVTMEGFDSTGGVEGALFALLDTETDPAMRKDVQETVLSLLQSQGRCQLVRWLSLVKGVLQAGRTGEAGTRGGGEDGAEARTAREEGGADDGEDEDDDVTLKGAKEEESNQLAPRWPTRVFAMDCLRRLMVACEACGEPQHLDLTLAREVKSSTGRSDSLVLHLSELVRMAFIAATSYSDRLRLSGLAALQDIIVRFAKVPEPEFHGHVILEQYQAQVGAALRPAFAAETASDVTAAACEVCSTWIGSGVARDLNDLRRVHQLLVFSLGKLRMGKNQAHLYSESASTMEKLAVLRAWAEVYIVAMTTKSEGNGDSDDETSGPPNEDLLGLVRPEMSHLTQHWLSALRDHALLFLPAELASQLPAEGGAFYHPECADTSREHYRRNWAPLLQAASLWLDAEGFTEIPANMNAEIINSDRLNLIMGICVEAMCNLVSKQPVEVIQVCLRSISTLLSKPWPRSALTKEEKLPIEMLNVMHRVFLTRDCIDTHLLCVEVMTKILQACQEKLTKDQETKQRACSPSSLSVLDQSALDNLGEGGSEGRLPPSQSAVFATLEVVLCGLTRYLPSLPPASMVLPPAAGRNSSRAAGIVARLLAPLPRLLDLTSPAGALAVLPALLQLTARTAQVALLDSDQPLSSPGSREIRDEVVRVLVGVADHRHAQSLPQWYRLVSSGLMAILRHSTGESNGGIGANDATEGDTLPSRQLASSHPPGPCCLQALELVSRVVAAPSAPVHLLRYLDLRTCLLEQTRSLWTSQADHPARRVLTVHAVARLIEHPEPSLAAQFIKSATPPMIRWLYSNPPVASQDDLNLVKSLIELLESLVRLAEAQHRTGMLLLLVPFLISLVDSPSTGGGTKTSAPVANNNKAAAGQELRQLALARVMAVGPLYPEDFRRVMAVGDLKPRLETALRANQKSSSAMTTTTGGVANGGSLAADRLTAAKPTIQLKMDFSNFK